MAEDTFIREVDEQLRQDRAAEFWSKYRNFILGGAVGIVLATAGYTYWQHSQQQQAGAAGDKYMQAIDLSNEGKHDEAVAALQAISNQAPGQYPALAKMRLAVEMVAKGDKSAALKEYDAIAADSSFNAIFRELAQLRAGLLAVDLEDYASVEKRLSGLAAAGAGFRHSAREALGIAALKAGNDPKALEWFQAISDDSQAGANVKSRAETMLNLLAGKGVKAAG